MKVRYKQLETINEFIDAIRLRVDVFIIEQHCPPGWEPDDFDKISLQFVALVDDKIVATARLREDPKHIGKIERMVVKKEYRNKGIGTGLTKYVIKQARKRGYKKVRMQAQVHAIHLYENNGFKIISKPYDLFNLGIPHVDMELVI